MSNRRRKLRRTAERAPETLTAVANLLSMGRRVAVDCAVLVRLCFARLKAVLLFAQSQAAARRLNRRLCVCETVQLGDKRIVALLKIDNRHILVGASANSVSMLAEIPVPANFSEVLRQHTALQQAEI